MMNIDVKRASCRVEFDYFLKGSVLKRTVASGCTAVRTHFEVESDAAEEQVRDLIRNAKQGCYAESMITTAVPLTSTINLNGNPLDLEGITGD
jgi:uncharacterized OsmC-like protein